MSKISKEFEEILIKLEGNIAEFRKGKICDPNVGVDVIKIGVALETSLNGPEGVLKGLLALMYTIVDEDSIDLESVEKRSIH
jgi:hypothetical protein